MIRRLIARPAAALAVAWALLAATPAPIREVMPPDEPRFALVAEEMRQGAAAGRTDGLVVPRLAGRVYTDKPPVLFWLVNLAALPFGRIGETACRIPSLAASLIVLLLTARWTRRLTRSPELALTSGLMLLTTVEFFQRAQWCSTDMPLAGLTLGAGTLWSEALQREAAGGGRARAAIALGWLLAALACLTKGPLGLLWSVLWPAAEALARGAPRGLPRIVSVPGIALFAVICGGWLAAAERISPGFVSAVLLHQSLERYVNAWNNVQPWYFYLYQLPLDLMPWTVLLPGALVVAWRLRRRADDADAIPLRAALWLLAPAVVFFSLSTGKRGVYLLPAFPAAALLAAVSAARLRGWGRAASGAALVVLALISAGAGAAAAAGLLPASQSLARIPEPLVRSLGAGLLAGGLIAAAGVVLWVRRKEAGGGLALALSFAPTFLVAATLGGAAWSAHQAAAPFGAEVAARVPEDMRIGVERGKFELILWYARRGGFEWEDPQDLSIRLASGEAGWVLIEKPTWERMRPGGDCGSLEPVWEGRISGTSYVLARARTLRAAQQRKDEGTS